MAAIEPILSQPNNIKELEHLLQLLLAPDTRQIAVATETIKQFLRQPTSVQPMIQVLTTSTERSVRQEAAVLLRMRIGKLWNRLERPVQTLIKQVLLERLDAEDDRLVSHSVAALVSAVAKHTVPKNEWNELPTLLLGWSKSQNVHQREIAMMLFRALAENIGNTFKPHFRVLQQVFTSGLTDASERVRTEAVYALGVLVELIENEQTLALFKLSIQPLIDVVKAHISHGQEDVIAAAFDVFETLADSEVHVLDNHVPALIELLLQVLMSEQLDLNIKDKCATLAATLIEMKPKSITKSKLVEPVLRTGLMLLCEPDDDCFNSEDLTIQQVAVELLDSALLNLPKKFIFTPTLQASSAAIHSANHHERKAGLVLVAVMAENAPDSLRAHLEQVVPVVANCLNDSQVLVRMASCVALSQIGDNLNEEIVSFHSAIVPRILHLLDNPSEKDTVKERAMVVLEVFLEVLEGGVVEYLPTIMPRFFNVITSHGTSEFKERVVTALTAAIGSAGGHFVNYFDDTFKLLAPLMVLKDDTELQLRSHATICMGQLAQTCGYQVFQPYLDPSIKVVLEGFQLNSHEVREANFLFISSIAEMLNADFAPHLNLFMPLVLASCLSQEGVRFAKHGSSLDDDGDDDIDSSDPDEDDDDKMDKEMRRMTFRIRTGALDEKVAAVKCLAHCVAHGNSSFLPFLPKTMEYVEELCEYPHPYVRQAALNVIVEILRLMSRLHKQKLVKGEAIALNPEVKQIVKPLVSLLLTRIVEEDDKEVCAVSCDAFVEVFQLFGLGAVQNSIKAVNDAMLTLLKGKAICQRAEQDEDEEIVADHDAILMDSVTDLIVAWAQASGPPFDKYFKTIFSLMMKFYDVHRNSQDRGMAIGCLAEIAAELGAGISSYLPRLLPAVLSGIADNSIVVRRNSCFAYGILCTLCLPDIVNSLPKGIPLLCAVYNNQLNRVRHAGEEQEFDDNLVAASEFASTKDNATSAIGKILVTSFNVVEYKELLPIFLSHLPLRGDYAEAKSVYGAVMKLYEQHFDAISPYTPQIMGIWSQVLGDADVDTAVQHEMATFAKSLASRIGNQQMQQILQTAVPTEHRDRFVKFLTQ